MKKAGAILLTILLAISNVAPVNAAEDVSPVTTDNPTYYADYVGSYQRERNGLTYFGIVNSYTSITAGSAMSNQTVMIISRAYPESGSGTLGSGGNAGTGSTSTTYSTTSELYYCINEHSAPNVGEKVTIVLIRN